MPDPDAQTPDPSDQVETADTETPPPVSEQADAALRAAQEAVTKLRDETSDDNGEGEAQDATAGDPDDRLRAAQDAIAQARAANASGDSGEASPLDLPAFNPTVSKPNPGGLDLLSDVNLNVRIELGRTRMLVEDVLRLGEGSVVELDKLAGDPVDVYVNDRHVAKGEVLVLNDNFCVRVNEIIAPLAKQQGGNPEQRS